MKIGQIRVYRVFGCCYFVLGPKPVAGPVCAFILLGMFTFVLSLMTLAIDAGIWRTIGIIGIVLNALLFIKLSFSNPGIPQ